jgi:hypothetical protein
MRGDTITRQLSLAVAVAPVFSISCDYVLFFFFGFLCVAAVVCERHL